MNSFIHKTPNRLTGLEKKLMVARGEESGEGTVRALGMDMCTLLYLKWITNKDLFIAHGTSLNVMWQPGWEESVGRMRMWICMAKSLYCAPEIITMLLLFLITTLLISYTSIQNKDLKKT